MTLQRKSALVVFLLGSTLLLVMSVVHFSVGRNQIIKQAQVSSVEMVEDLSHALDLFLMEKGRVTNTIATAPVITDALIQSNSEYAELGDSERQQRIDDLNARWLAAEDIQDPIIQGTLHNSSAEYLRKQQTAFPGEYGEIFVTNRYGALVASTGKLTTLAHAHKYWWSASYQEGKGTTFFDDRGYDTSVEGYVLGVVAPIRQGAEIIGILKCNLNVAGALTSVIKSLGHHEDAEAQRLVRAGGLVVLEEGKMPLSTSVPAILVEQMREGKSGSLIAPGSEGAELLAYAPVKVTQGTDKYSFGGSPESMDHLEGNVGEGWYVTSSVPLEQILNTAERSTGFLVAIGIVFSLLMALGSALAARTLARPLVTLVESVQRIGKGDLDTEVGSTSRNEFGVLAKAFNTMVQDLRTTLVSRDHLIEEVEQRKQAEDALRDSEKRYRAVAEDTPVLICRFLPGGEITYANQAYCAYFDKTPEELVGSSFLSLVPEADRDAVMVNISTMTVESSKQSHEHRVIGRDGEIRWQRWTNGALFDTEGQPTAYQSIGEDITNRKRAEEALRASEERTLLVIDGAELGTWDWNFETSEVVFNERWAAMLGHTLDEFEPKVSTWEKLIHPDDMPGVEEVLNAHFEGKTDHYEAEHRLKHKSGEWIWVLDKGRVIKRDAKGKPLRMCGTHLDITERKQAEEALYAAKTFSDGLIDTAQAIILVLDTKGRIVRFNTYLEALSGYRLEEVKGKDWFTTFLPQADHNRIRDLFAKAVDDIQTKGNINPIRAKDGREIIVEWHDKTLRGPEGSTVGVLAIGVDITERKQAEEELAATTSFLDTVVDRSPFAMWVADPNGTIIRTNQALREVLNLTDEQLIGKYNVLADTNLDRQGLAPRVARVFEKHEPARFDMLWQAAEAGDVDLKGARDRDVDVSFFPILSTEGKLTHVVCQWVDITERMQAEEALRQSEERARLAIDGANLGMWDWNVETGEAVFNERFGAMLGYTLDEIKPHVSAWEKRVQPDDMPSVKEALNAHLEGKTDYYETEHRLKRKSGTWIWVLAKGRVIKRNAKGKPLRMCGTHLDITERKQAEAALRDSEAKMRLLIEQSPLGVCINDLDGTFVSASPAYEKLIGYTEEELQKLTFFDITHPDDCPENRRLFQDMTFDQTVSFRMEKRYIRKDGSEIPVIVHAGPICDPSGSPLFGLALVEDITERKQAEAERERLLHDTAERVKELRCMYGVTETIRTHETLEQIFTEVVALIPSGWHFPEATRARIRLDDQEYVSQSFDETEWQQRVDIIVSGEPRGTIEVFYTEAPRLFYCCPNVAEWEGFIKEEQELLDGIARALSEAIEHHEAEAEREKAEEQLRQAQKMEAIGTLAGGIAHDFNNILYSILGFTEMAAAEVDKHSPAREMLGEVEKAGRRASELVNQILAISRKQDKKLEPLLLQMVVKEAMGMLRGTLPSTIETIQHIDEDCGTVMADATEMHQIVLNLCTNAYHAMHDHGGILSIELKKVRLTESEADAHSDLRPTQYARLDVADTGYGMEPETMLRIFEPYYTTKDTGEGTGLGLATVHGIVLGYGGAVTVESKIGEGTTFTVFFPLAAQADVPREKKEMEGAAQGRGESLLIIDDEEQLARLHRMALERLGYRVKSFTVAGEALEAFRSHPSAFDLVITDQTMPKMTGVELSEQILEIRSDIPIVLCTGHSDLIDERSARKMGIRAYLKKPIIARDLANTVRRLLDKAQGGAKGGNPKD
jgi:PAS domain S-box-containing protein